MLGLRGRAWLCGRLHLARYRRGACGNLSVSVAHKLICLPLNFRRPHSPRLAALAARPPERPDLPAGGFFEGRRVTGHRGERRSASFLNRLRKARNNRKLAYKSRRSQKEGRIRAPPRRIAGGSYRRPDAGRRGRGPPPNRPRVRCRPLHPRPQGQGRAARRALENPPGRRRQGQRAQPNPVPPRHEERHSAQMGVRAA